MMSHDDKDMVAAASYAVSAPCLAASCNEVPVSCPHGLLCKEVMVSTVAPLRLPVSVERFISSALIA